MKLSFFVAFFLCLAQIIFSQESKPLMVYEFDYFLEYTCGVHENNKSEKTTCSSVIYMLTNSKDNSYVLHVYKEDEDNFKVVFNVFGKYQSFSYMTKDDFFKAETINLECNYLLSKNVEHQYKGGSKNHHAHVALLDTIINKKAYKQYAYKTSKERRSNRALLLWRRSNKRGCFS